MTGDWEACSHTDLEAVDYFYSDGLTGNPRRSCDATTYPKCRRTIGLPLKDPSTFEGRRTPATVPVQWEAWDCGKVHHSGGLVPLEG